MKQKKKRKSKILIIIGIILMICIGGFVYLVIEDLKQEDILKQEIVNVSNKDLLTDNFNIEVKTKGDYAYIEEAVKKYYQELSNSVKIIHNYLNDESLINILSADNLASDQPNFTNSYQTLEKTKTNVTESIQAIATLCEEETIKNLIDKEKVDDYSYELYLKLMYTKDDLKSLQETKQEAETLSQNLTLFLDKVKEILDMLAKNSNHWTIENSQIYFDTDNLVTEYNNLYNELNQIANEKFSSIKKETDNTSQSDI